MNVADLHKVFFRARECFLVSLILSILSTFAQFSHASGVLPETTTVIINEEQQGGSINVKNTHDVPVLLFSKVVELPDEPTPQLIVTQPVVRLEPGQSQRVRLLLRSDAPLQREHIKRIYFEGIAEQPEVGNQITVSVRQDLPVIIAPKGLAVKNNMWTDLNWSIRDERLTVKNTGRQVVRLSPQLKLLPTGTELSLEKSYILPGETLVVPAPADTHFTARQQVEFSPVTRYGFDAGPQKVDLSGQ